MRKILLLAAFSLAGCSPDIQSLANDPATLSIHQVITAPGWNVTTDVTRVNSTNTAASANGSGAAVNVPNGAIVNSAPTKPAPAATLGPIIPSTGP